MTILSRYSLLACLMIKRGGEIEPNTSYVRSCARVDIPLAQYWSIVLGVDSWLRKLGIYGSFVFTSNIRSDSWKSKIEVGYIPPAWLCSRSISLDVQLSSIAAGQLGIQILPGSIRVQNRVPLDSPFMTACRRGDVRLIQQHLASRTGFVGDRSTCTGQTPLMVL